MNRSGENLVLTILQRLLLVAVVACASITYVQAEINFTSWGGDYEISQQKAYVDTWQKGKVNFLKYSGGLDQIRSQVMSGTVTWDIVDVLPHDARVGCEEGLFEELDRNMFEPAADGTSMDDDIMVQVPNDCVVPQAFWSYVPFYKKGTFKGDQPTTIGDFFNVDKFPGKRGIHLWPNALIEMALVADGVGVNDVYKVMSTEVGMDRAFDKLDSIRDHLAFWNFGGRTTSAGTVG